jgi:predicted GIY-YIG superfamily endonuclease
MRKGRQTASTAASYEPQEWGGNMAIYILHFDTPYKHARHYVGYTKREKLEDRLDEHRAGNGARLMEVVTDAGIGFEVSRVIKDGTRAQERRIKVSGHTRRLCPLCNPKSWKKNNLVKREKKDEIPF